MSRFQHLDDLFERRLLNAITRDLDAQRTTRAYDEELQRQRELLDVVLIPEIKLHRADVQLLTVKKEEPSPEQQERSPYPDQEDFKSQLIKEEQEEQWIPQGELQGLAEADTKVLFTSVHRKSEDDEEKPESSLLHQKLTDHIETAAGGEDCGGPETAKSSDPDKNLQPEIEVKIEDSDTGSGSEDGADDWKEIRDCFERLKSARNKRAESVKSHHLPEPGKTYHLVPLLEMKPFSCSVCEKGFNYKVDLTRHMLVHTKEKPYSCPDCGKRFNQKGNLNSHRLVHSNEKPFSCSECGKTFNRKGNLAKHMFVHTKEKPFSCSECGKKFSTKGNLTKHMYTHSVEKPYSCFECGKGFACKGNLTKHMYIHAQHKPQCFECRTGINPKVSPTTNGGTQLKMDSD